MFDYFYGAESEKFLFYQIPVPLVKEKRFSKLSTDAKLLYGILLSKTRLSSRNGWLDDKGRVYVYYTVKEVKDDFACSNDKATKVFQELEDIGLIERRRQPNKPALIYVKNFDSSQISEKQNSGFPNNRIPDFRKSEPIYIDNNNIDINNNLSINLGKLERKEEKRKDRSIDKIKRQIDYEALVDGYGVAETTLDFYVDIIAEGYASGNDDLVGKLGKVDMFDVLYVLDSLETSKPRVANIRAYILKCLENAHDSRDLYYELRRNNDLRN